MTKYYSRGLICFLSFLLFLINLFYFTILYWLCHTLTWICHGCTCVLHPEPLPTSLPILSLWVIPVHQPRASCITHRTWTGDLFHIWYYMFQCHSPKSTHPRPLPQSPKDCSIHLCLFCCLAYTYRKLVEDCKSNKGFVYDENQLGDILNSKNAHTENDS